jgi:ABC-type branched-subunit amino acid transport system ATPase component
VPTLEVRSLSKRFGGVHALDDVSFTVDRGEIFGIIGPNGAGKTTLLNIAAGVMRPTSGEVLLEGEVISGLRPPAVVRRGVARAHQVPRPFKQMTLRQHLDIAARVHRPHRRARRELVDAVLDRTGLARHADRVAGDLGLLDLKRLEIARAVAMSPRVLLLDEVAAGLVGQEITGVVALIREIQADGLTIVMVEHVQALIRELAARVMVLEWGRKLTEGTPTEVVADRRVIEAYLGQPVEKDVEVARETQARATALVELIGVGVNYGRFPALRDCDLSIAPGEVVALVGANGAGKTTLSRAIAGMVHTHRGEIRFAGADISRLSAHQRARAGIALCHEGRRLFTEQSVRDNLLTAAHRAARTDRTAADRIAEVLALFPELEPLLTRQAALLSGGEQQMVAIGRALALDPKLVIFDELSLGLAPRIVARLLEAIPVLQQRGIAILLIEQNVAQALTVADHVYVLDHGHVVFSGSPADVVDDPRLHAAYLGAVPAAEAPAVITERERTPAS